MPSRSIIAAPVVRNPGSAGGPMPHSADPAAEAARRHRPAPGVGAMRSHGSIPSLADIASRAAVSRAAVSMALRNHPRISAATRTRVQKIAQRLGWRPNPLLAGAMSTIRAGQPPADQVVLAWVTAHPRRDTWQRDPFFLRCFEGARSRALAMGYHLKHFWLGDAEGSSDRLSSILYARGIAGLVIAPLPKPGALNLAWSRFCAVAIGHSLTKPRLHRAIGDNCASAREAVSKLAEEGRRRIALVLTADQDRRVNGLWSAGYLLQSLDSNCYDPALLFRPDKLQEKPFLAWIETAQPDAILGIDLRIPAWLRRSTRFGSQPEITFASLNLPGPVGEVSGIYQDAHEIGACAIDLLARQLVRHERGIPRQPTTVLIESRWLAAGRCPATAAGTQGGAGREGRLAGGSRR